GVAGPVCMWSGSTTLQGFMPGSPQSNCWSLVRIVAAGDRQRDQQVLVEVPPDRVVGVAGQTAEPLRVAVLELLEGMAEPRSIAGEPRHRSPEGRQGSGGLLVHPDQAIDEFPVLCAEALAPDPGRGHLPLGGELLDLLVEDQSLWPPHVYRVLIRAIGTLRCIVSVGQVRFRGGSPVSTVHRGLDVPTVVRTSLAIADAEGLDGLTMRRLASELDVTPMAIYHH